MSDHNRQVLDDEEYNNSLVSSVDSDFFDRGQQLVQVPRQSVVEAVRDQVKIKLIKTITIHFVWDVLCMIFLIDACLYFG